MLAATTDSTVRLWDVNISRRVRPRTGRSQDNGLTRPASSLLTAEDSPQLPAPVYEYSAEHDFEQKLGKLRCVDWSSKGNALAVGGEGGNHACVLDLVDETIEYIPLPSDGEKDTTIVGIRFVEKSSDLLLLASSTGKVVLWDRAKKRVVETYETLSHPLSRMAVSASSKYFAVASRRGGEVLLVSREKGTQSTFKIPSSQAINAMDISPGYKASVLVGNDGGDLHLFDTVRSSTAPSKTWKLAHNAPVHGLAYSSIERRVAYSVGLDKCLKRVDDASRAGVSLVANVDVPLTSVCCDPVMGWVGVGGMDGLVRVYDVRQSKAPVWKAAVDGDKCVTSVSLSSGPASLVGGGKGNGVHIVRMARSRSDISEYPENSCTNEGPGRVHAVLKPTAREVASRPPINPAISVSKRVNKPRPVSAALPPTSELSAKLPLETPLPRAASLVKDMYNDSVYLKDRSYMDMFSPVKTAAEASSLRPPSTTKILEDDASPPTSRPTPERGDPPSRRPYEERLGLDRPLSPSEAAAPCPPVACGVATGVVPQTLQSQSPSLLSPSSPPALPPSLRQPVLPAAAGDSMMEIFTPKDRDHRLLKPIRQTSRTSAGSPPHHSATKPIASYSGASVPPCIIPEATAPSGAESAVQASTANGQTTTKELPHTDIQPPSPQVDASHAVTFSGSRPGGPPPTATELKPTLQIFEDAHQPRPTVTGDRIAPSQPGISSSLIQQAVKDAITPFCNQMRNDLLNLHLDIIRQGQECKSYFWVLSQIQNENQELRKEVQRLALENERLRRFLPYSNICYESQDQIQFDDVEPA